MRIEKRTSRSICRQMLESSNNGDLLDTSEWFG